MGDVIDITERLQARKLAEEHFLAQEERLEALRTVSPFSWLWGCPYCGSIFDSAEERPLDHKLRCGGDAG